MSFAPYYNEPNMTQPRLLGQFDVNGVWFEFSNRPEGDRDGTFPGYPHRIFTLDGDRAALVLKTVAYVVVDEDDHGGPIHEKWELKRCKRYI
jgi:hypothetical protein